MAKIPFTVSARTAKLIGQENFANSEGAVVELVKNTYDADALVCFLIIDDTDPDPLKHEFYIIDNGIGMTSEVIINHWMMIGTADKLLEHESELGRVKTGAKGIGRFALNRLGLKCEMTTAPKGQFQGHRWAVDWSDFDKVGIAINQVEAELKDIPNFDYGRYLIQKFGDFPPIKKLLDEISLEHGTELRVYPLNDSWEEENLKRLFSNLELLVPPREQSDFAIHLFSLREITEYGEVESAFCDDFDYKVDAEYKAGEEMSLKITISRNELDFGLLERQYSGIFEKELMKSFPFRLQDFKKESFTLLTSLPKLRGFKDVDQKLLNEIGQFQFTFYFLKNTISDNKAEGDKKKFPYKNFESANRKAWLQKFGGVKIYRDDFRVRPYGEKGEDWLKLGERQSKSPGGAGQRMGGYRIAPNQIAGTVRISRIHNTAFQDKSGREGIQENDTFELFKQILLEIIAHFERDRNTVMYNLAELARERNKAEADKQRAQEEARRILEEEERSKIKDKVEEQTADEIVISGPTEREKILAKATRIFEQEIEDKDAEIRLLRSLASNGLIIASFAHEVRGLRSRLVPRSEHLHKVLKGLIKDELLSSLRKQDNPFFMLQAIREEDIRLKHWLDYSLSALKQDKRKRKNLNFGEYFEEFKSNWEKALKQRKVSLRLEGTKDIANTVRAFPVDMDTIFNNLLTNAMDSLKQVRNKKKTVVISWKRLGNYVEILFSDNGIGLDEEFHSDPDQIFSAFETSKRNRKGEKIGTGIGLYLVKTIVDDHNDARVSVSLPEEGFQVKLTFPTRKKIRK